MNACGPIEPPAGLTRREYVVWLEAELERECLRRDTLECRVQRLTDALARAQREEERL